MYQSFIEKAKRAAGYGLGSKASKQAIDTGLGFRVWGEAQKRSVGLRRRSLESSPRPFP